MREKPVVKASAPPEAPSGGAGRTGEGGVLLLPTLTLAPRSLLLLWPGLCQRLAAPVPISAAATGRKITPTWRMPGTSRPFPGLTLNPARTWSADEESRPQGQGTVPGLPAPEPWAVALGGGPTRILVTSLPL